MIAQIRPRDLKAWLDSHPASSMPIVLDVREAFELQIARVKPDDFNLLSIPMGTVPVRLNELDKSQPIAVLCHHGGRSMQVAQFLMNQGFSHLANIAGGIHAWSAELDPTIPTY